MTRDDREQLEYIENWRRKQQDKEARKENKKIIILMHYCRFKEYFKLGFKSLIACIKEVFKF